MTCSRRSRFAGPCIAAFALLAFVALPLRADVVTVADGVHVDLGSPGAITPANRGEVANSGLIVGRTQMLAIDSGVSRAHGERLYAAWRRRAELPFAALLLTQAAPEFVFGAGAFQAHGVAVRAHRDAAAAMRQRCENCLTRLREQLPGGLMKGTVLVAPEVLDETLDSLDLGDRRVQLITAGTATTPGTLAVFDAASGTLFAGGLVADQRIPSLRDARIAAWLAVLQRLDELPLQRVVPGFGRIGGRERIVTMQRYLRQIDQAVRAEYQRGASLLEATAAVQLPEFAGWSDYGTTHAQNVQVLYRQLEAAEFN